MSFKDKFAELTQSTWEKERDAYDFYRDELSEALAAHASEQSLESAKAWVGAGWKTISARYPKLL